MARYKYEFSTVCRFTPAVCRHSFKLRVQPMAGPCQEIVEERVSIEPSTRLSASTDSFGNRVLYGLVDEPHPSFSVVSSGIVVCHHRPEPDDSPAEFYRYPTPLTHCDQDLRRMVKGLSPLRLMEAVHGSMQYRRFCSNNATTAIEAFRQHAGVCQDFAHVMLAACRAEGFLARYVSGMVPGEGETHAWVEVYEDGHWQAYDPTFNRPADESYIKLAHGRDTNDCAVNRGRFYNLTNEQMTVKCIVTHDTDSDFT
ncbi:MAG: transglutaminase domain-containing protein [Alloprevotella sp.]